MLFGRWSRRSREGTRRGPRNITARSTSSGWVVMPISTSNRVAACTTSAKAAGHLRVRELGRVSRVRVPRSYITRSTQEPREHRCNSTRRVLHGGLCEKARGPPAVVSVRSGKLPTRSRALRPSHGSGEGQESNHAEESYLESAAHTGRAPSQDPIARASTGDVRALIRTTAENGGAQTEAGSRDALFGRSLPRPRRDVTARMTVTSDWTTGAPTPDGPRLWVACRCASRPVPSRATHSSHATQPAQQP